MTTEELNAKIEALCAAKGMTFSLHECPLGKLMKALHPGRPAPAARSHGRRHRRYDAC